jgi:hypothetical protein
MPIYRTMHRDTRINSLPSTTASSTTSEMHKEKTSHGAPEHGATHSLKPVNCGTPKRRIGLGVSCRLKGMKLFAITLRYFVAFEALVRPVLTTFEDDLEHYDTCRHGFRHLTLRGNIRRRSLLATWEHSGRVAPTRHNKRQRQQHSYQRLSAVCSSPKVQAIR